MAEIIYIPPNKTIKYGYFLYIPEGIQSGQILLWMHASTRFDTSYEDLPDELRRYPRNITSYCDRLSLVGVTPILPRNNSQEEYPFYKLDSQAMTAEVMTRDIDIGDALYFRPDLEVLKIIEEVRSRMSNRNIQPKEKVTIGGISAGASFANRFSVLHPEVVDKVILLIGGEYMYPEKSLNNVQLEYPFGLSSLGNIIDHTPSTKRFQKIHHIIYIGDQDKNTDNDALGYELNDDQEKIDSYQKVLGEDSVVRTKKFSEYLKSKGMHIDLEIGKGVDHRISGEVLDWAFGKLSS